MKVLPWWMTNIGLCSDNEGFPGSKKIDCEVWYIKEWNWCIIDNGEESNSKIYSKWLFKLTYNGRDYYYSDWKDKYCSFITSQVVPNFSQEEQKNN